MGVAETAQHLTGGRLLARNTIWNLLGQLLPMAVGIVTVPPLIRGLGIARFGVLSLAWIVIGYFSLFDLGIGRALTKLVADKLVANEERSIPSLAWTSLLLLFVLGSIGGGVMASSSSWLVHKALRVAPELAGETLWTFYLLAVSMPVVTVTSGLRGMLEALQRFRILNLIRIPTSVFSFVGPLLVLPFSHSLVPVICVLLAGRLIGSMAHLLACFYAMPSLRDHVILERSVVAPVVRFGGWMTVSNIVSPIMVYIDRFLIGALLSVRAIAYYTAPFDMVTRLWVVPGAVTSVLFPAFAMSLTWNAERAELLLSRGIKYVLLALFPVVLVVVSFAPEGLRLWLGPVFAQNSAAALRWLAAGILVNSFAQIPSALIQSAGRPDITSKVQSAELPFYLVAVWLLTKKMGIEGTAIAWSGRMALDAIILCWCARSFLKWRHKSLAILGTTTAAELLLCYVSTLPSSFAIRSGFVGLVLLGFGLVGWFLVLAPGERMFVSGIRAKVTTRMEHTS